MKLVEKFAHPKALTRAQTIEFFNEFTFFHRACAHALAGMIPRMQDIEAKLALLPCLAHDAEMADLLNQRLEALQAFEAPQTMVPANAVACLRLLEQAPDAVSLVAALKAVIHPGLLRSYKHFLLDADPLLDAKSVELARRALHFLGTTHLPQVSGSPAYLAQVTELWGKRRSGELTQTGLTGRPDGHCPEPIRPVGLEFGARGAMRPLFKDLLHNSADIGRFLHQLMDNCLLSAEIIARMSHEAAFMSGEFHREMAEQAWSYGRQFKLIERSLITFGYHYGDFPLDRSAYELCYRFKPCKAFSKEELLWRLLLKITWFQANELGPFESEFKTRTILGQPDLARLFGRLACDAVAHVRMGLKWSRALCGGDASLAFETRKTAKEYLDQVLLQRQAQFMVSNPQLAMAQMKAVQEVKDFIAQKPPQERELGMRRFSSRLRSQAGFLDEEIAWAAQKLENLLPIGMEEEVHAG